MNLKHQVQCSHNNRGFCRFRDKCYYPHFTKACSKKVCRDQACLFRHPKSCKFGEDCKFYKKKICAFKHAETDKELAKIKKEINDFEEEVMMLKGDVSNLKNSIKTKEEDLEAKLAVEAEQLKLTTDLSQENEELKSIIANYGIENRYLKKERSDKDYIITELNEKLSYFSDKMKDQSKVVPSRNKCDKCDSIDERSSMIESFTKENNDTNEDLRGKLLL